MNTGFSQRFCRRCLTTSLSVEQMNRFAKITNKNYDLNKSFGPSKGHAISVQEAADCIVADMVKSGYYIDFVETLIKVDSVGYMGHKFPIRGLDDVISDVIQAGYNFDKTTGLFFEDQNQQVTRNWGRLMEGDERTVAVMRLDIAGNSLIVKNNPKQLVEKAFGDLRKFITDAVVSRLGRLWIWEGDGALGVFMLGGYSSVAVFAAMEILNEMFLYNKTENQLKSDINLRIAVHSGEVAYSKNDANVLKADVVKTAMRLESKAALSNSLVISESLAMSLDQSMTDVFGNIKIIPNSTEKFRIYNVSQGKS